MPNFTRYPTFSEPLIRTKNTGSRGFVKLRLVAAAAMLCASLVHHDEAAALALGRISLQSAIGEPLSAEIEVLEISAEEASNLRVGLASVDAFRAAGMEFGAALNGIQINLQRRADGRAYLSLTGSRPVSEPFMDLVLEANWASGRIVRNYTLLLDPPKTQAAAPAPIAPTPAQITLAAPAERIPAPAPSAAAASTAQPTMKAPAAPTRSPEIKPPSPSASEDTVSESSSKQLRVKAGDTAGKIAAAHQPASASLDQMLVALLRANPSAFIDGNVNWLKAGAILDIPAESAVAEVSSTEARRIVATQSRDFNAFRRQLAAAVPAADVAAADRQASGKLQTEVEDKKPAVSTQDKLTLSKDSATQQSAKEEAIAKERQTQEAAARVAELTRNIDELSKAGPAAPEGTAAGAPAQPAAPNTAAPQAPVVVAASPPAPAPAPAPAPKPPVTAPAPQEEVTFIDELLENPLVLPGAGALLALLGGLALYRQRQKKKVSGVDSSFLESRLQPDSFFGNSGGQRINTKEAAASVSSMAYSPSQLDAAGDVDPVAEADVYLAYGRDLQAEEILKEALRSTPTRVAIHNKLLEIYAKRRDAKAFEVVAAEAFGLTQGQGPEWEQASALGKDLDPGNPLYQPGGGPVVQPGRASPFENHTIPFGISTLAPHTQPGALNASDVDLDLDLDLDLNDASSSDALSSAGDEHFSKREAMDTLPPSMADKSDSMNFGLEFLSEPMPLTTGDSTGSKANKDMSTFDDSEILSEFELEAPDQLERPVSEVGKSARPGPVAFDLNNLTLDLGPQSSTDSGAQDSTYSAEEAFETKLSLAEEFRAIGDLEGARSMAEEVLAESTGELKNKARSFLSKLT